MATRTIAERIIIRLAAVDKARLVRAARLRGTTLSDFVRAASHEAAELVLAGQTRFALPAEAWRQFTAALDAPARDIPALRKLFTTPSVLER